MSRFSKIMVALLASVAIAAPAFAVTGDVSGFLNVRGVASNNMDGRDKSGGMYDDNSRAVDQRLRLLTTAALNENVKMIFQIEVDNVWGTTTTASENSSDGSGKQVGEVGTDAKGQIEIKHIYLDFNVPELNANVKAGSQYFKLGGGLIIGEDAAGLQVRMACPIVEGNSIGLYWVKAVEGVGSDDDADVDYYQVMYDAKFGDWTVSPYFGFLDSADANIIGSWGKYYDEQYYYGVDVAGKVAGLGLNGTFIYNDGSTRLGDNTSFALKVGADYTIGDTKLVLEVAKYGDSDNKDNSGQFVNVRGYNNFAEIVTGGAFDGRASNGGTAATVLTSAANAPYYMNYAYIKAGAVQQLTDKLKLSGYYIYAKEAADTATHDAITFGHELDAYLDYIVVPGLTLTVGGGYLIADDDFGQTAAGGAADKTLGGDDAWKLGTGLLYKF